MITMKLTLMVDDEDHDSNSPDPAIPLTEDAWDRLNEALSDAGFQFEVLR